MAVDAPAAVEPESTEPEPIRFGGPRDDAEPPRPAAPLEDRTRTAQPLFLDGATPFDGTRPVSTAPSPSPSHTPTNGVAPLQRRRRTPGDRPPTVATPLGMGPRPVPPEPLDAKTRRLARVDFLLGPVWRIRQVDTILTTSAELGRMHGFSGSFHTSMIVVSQRGLVSALDFPIGLGAVARGRLGDKPLYGSVGLSAGMLIHRAAIEGTVVHRVDPDFRAPVRLAWTIADIGVSLAVVPGFSVRERTYERRGVEVWNRHSFRIALVLGLHWDFEAGRAKPLRRAGRRDGDS